jgi:hypothetical protein
MAMSITQMIMNKDLNRDQKLKKLQWCQVKIIFIMRHVLGFEGFRCKHSILLS